MAAESQNADGTLGQLRGFVALLRRSGALAPFLNAIIITLFPVALVALKDANAFGVPLMFWALVLVAGEAFLTLVAGIILIFWKPELLMTEQHQEKMLQMQIGEKGRCVEDVLQNPEESDGRSEKCIVSNGQEVDE